MATDMERRPPNFDEIISALRRHRHQFDERYHIRSLGLFGSVVRGEQSETSDVDVLIEFDEVPSLLTLIRLERELSELLGAKVDLVMRDALKPTIGERIPAEVEFL